VQQEIDLKDQYARAGHKPEVVQRKPKGGVLQKRGWGKSHENSLLEGTTIQFMKTEGDQNTWKRGWEVGRASNVMSEEKKRSRNSR